MQNFPNPNDFDDWRSWASEMQKQVEQEFLRLGSQSPRLSIIKEQPGKARNGYPIAGKGDLIGVLGSDASASPVLKIWWEGQWRTI
jgi:hypothetical protein